jgi:predicted DNA-binding transcriptional regulator AlpA
MRIPPEFRPRIGTSDESELLTVREAARYLRISKYTLDYWRRLKTRRGPRYFKLHPHAVRYRLIDLSRFLDKCAVDPAR